MIKRLNFTGRRKIPQRSFNLTLSDAEDGTLSGSLSFSEDLLPGYPSDSRITVEAYMGPRQQRFRLGETGSFTGCVNLVLNRFSVGECPLFRIKIVRSEPDDGMILGWADRISPAIRDRDGDAQKAILPVIARDLGDEIWQLEFSDPFRPVLLVNSRISVAKEITSIARNDADFRALAFPAVLREILQRIYLIEDGPPDEDCPWGAFAEKLGAGDPPEDGDDENHDSDVCEWIERAVRLFALSIQGADKYVEFKKA